MLFPPSFTPLTHSPSPGITISGCSAGSGPPLLFLHGYPQTHAIWHKIAPQLTSDYTVVLLDLRGYGASSKPPSSASHAAYAKSALAADCVSTMASLGHASFFVCAHDRGARVTHAMCMRYPDAVRKAILLDIVPTKRIYDKADAALATAYFHWFFLAQPAPFPEQMIGGAPEQWLKYCLQGGGATGVQAEGVFTKEAWGEYETLLKDPEAVRATCEDYRAGPSVDMREQEEDEREGRKVRAPLRVLWGARGVVEKLFDGVGDWKMVHETGEVSGEAVDSGHFIPEENPEAVLKHIKEFLV